MLVAGLSAASVTLGAGMAYWANGHPRHCDLIQTIAGLLIIAGVALLGFGLERAVGCP